MKNTRQQPDNSSVAGINLLESKYNIDENTLASLEDIQCSDSVLEKLLFGGQIVISAKHLNDKLRIVV